MTAVDETAPAPQLPFSRPDVLDIAPEYDGLRRDRPVAAVTTPAGDPAWLATGFTVVRDLLGDTRLGRSHPDPEHASRINDSAVQEGPSGDHETEAEDHRRMRRLLTPAFSARRMRALGEDVQALVDEGVDRMLAERETSPDGVVDLHAALAFPLPVAVICRLLGVPTADGDHFRELSDRMATSDPAVDPHGAREEFGRYMAGLAEAKRAQPGEDVISDLVAAYEADDDFRPEELVRLSVGLLFAGHETTVVQIGLGALLLLANRVQWQALVDDPALVTNAVEEMLRARGTGGGGIPRYARTDLVIDGVTVQAGDLVLLDNAAANHDPAVFADPDRMDVTRSTGAHLTFGHGARYCLGAPLARIELETVFSQLVSRFPTLRLDVAVEDLRTRHDAVTGGLVELPVRWDTAR